MNLNPKSLLAFILLLAIPASANARRSTMATDNDEELRNACTASIVPLNPPPMIKTSNRDTLTGEDLVPNVKQYNRHYSAPVASQGALLWCRAGGSWWNLLRMCVAPI